MVRRRVSAGCEAVARHAPSLAGLRGVDDRPEQAITLDRTDAARALDLGSPPRAQARPSPALSQRHVRPSRSGQLRNLDPYYGPRHIASGREAVTDPPAARSSLLMPQAAKLAVDRSRRDEGVVR
jgi:hypothetical protein